MDEQADSTLSFRERKLWIGTFVDLSIALYYWPQALRLMLAGDEALRGAAMVNLLISTVTFAIFLNAAMAYFFHREDKPEPMDERDYMIAARSSLVAVRVLTGSLVLLIGLVVLQEFPGREFAPVVLIPLSPLVMAHLLLVALMLWSVAGSLTQLYYYRKGL